MLLEPVDPEEMRSASLVTEFAMAAFIGARFMGPAAKMVRIVAAVIYIGAMLALIAYHLLA